jgi:hypothetical protein
MAVARRALDVQTGGAEVLAAIPQPPEFFDIAAVVVFLRKVIWTVPGFTVHAYRAQLQELHERIQADGAFVAHAQRFLIEARKPPVALVS